MARDRKKPFSGDTPATFHTPFADLQKKLGLERTPETPAPSDRPPPPAAAPDPHARARKEERIPSRAVVRLEKKGRGGKEVTVVEKLALPPAELDAWLKALKQSLGTGGTIEGDTIVIQGDQRDRVRALLSSRGIRQISVG